MALLRALASVAAFDAKDEDAVDFAFGGGDTGPVSDEDAVDFAFGGDTGSVSDRITASSEISEGTILQREQGMFCQISPFAPA